MVYKAGEGTLRRLSNTNSYPKHFLPLYTTLMSAMLLWNPFLICEIEVSPNGGPGFCCGMTKKGAPCKNSIKLEDTKTGYQKLNTVAREPFDLSNLQSKLCAIAKEFLCNDRPMRLASSDPLVPLLTSSEPVQSINSFVTAEMLRTNSVLWYVSPARLAILTSVTNIWAGV
ncbi:hypothetical protein N7449_005073 [Penicillium cf. viridicatum]|uniref:Uncharacterized protein n=1 Tax=Penicillium cf. viridicatum TaxID=2972119 RepID=A0A9W9MKF0_9EURO|nr:hypothetical protein N7449_005073 [Penicillium cf. viridicatum]